MDGEQLAIRLGCVLGGFKSSQHLEESGSDDRSAAFGSGFAGEAEVTWASGVARREDRRRFWALIADGLSSEDAAMVVGISQPVGTRWFRMEGGLAPSHLSRSSKPLSGRYLLFVEREEIALLRAQGLGVREVARRLGRSASTVSRELRRNAATRGGNLDYRATTAQWHAERAGRRPKPAKLATNPAVRAYVQERLAGTVAAPSGAAVFGPTVLPCAQAVDLIQEYEAKIAALERMVGRQALELELLKGALRHAPRPRSATTSVVTGPAVSPLPVGAN